MSKLLVTAGALGVAAVAAHVAGDGVPDGIQVPRNPEPLWSRLLRQRLTREFDLPPSGVPGDPYGTIAGAVVAHFRRLADVNGTITYGGDTVPKITVEKCGAVAAWWAELLASTFAIGMPAARRFVDEQAPVYALAVTYGPASRYDFELVKRLRRELAELAVALDDPRDSFEPSHPDERTYWDFLWDRAKDSTALKIGYAPFYVPYWVAGQAWDALPGVAGLARDVLGPPAKFLVTTFGVVLFVGGVGFYVWRKLAPKVTVAP